MDVAALKQLVMLQLGEDVEDESEYGVLLDTYLNSGYMLLMNKRKSGNLTGVDPLATSNQLPEWAHPALADYATYRILQNGNASKQQRAQAFYASFSEILSKITSEADETALNQAETDTGVRALAFRNLYT